MHNTDPQKPDAKQSMSMGCATVLLSFAIVVVGVVVAIIFRPDTAVHQVELNDRDRSYSLVETVSPGTFNRIAVELDLKGKRYFTRQIEKYSSDPGYDPSGKRRVRFKHLAYQVPIRVEVTRVADGEVILDHRHVFEIEPHEKRNVPKKEEEFEELGVTVANYPDFPELGQAEELRIDLTLEEDTTYGSRITSGALEVSEKGKSLVMSIGISMAILFMLLGMVVLGVMVIKWLRASFNKPRPSNPGVSE